MKNFEDFIDEIVILWRSEKKVILEKKGLGTPSNREIGDSAEDYILRKVRAMKLNYLFKKSNGSQSPSDVFAISKRGDFWHLMLIQVKSSTNKDSIYSLNANEVKVLNEFAKFLKTHIGKSELLTHFRKSSIVISTGYAGVYHNLKTNRNSLEKTLFFNSFNRNMGNKDKVKFGIRIRLSHLLGKSQN